MHERTRLVGGITAAILAVLAGVGSVGVGLLGEPFGVVLPLVGAAFVFGAVCAYLVWG
ncbi:hypothetical protein [Halospeciosus flavus]|uniref:Major facilitator superfamily (MFS) profile domain-containing protein n=1 Tax=Halospeciosus flavus TaxID=3032283 RepID=A0ABD5Z772_9EURY|nr:hypothetical protein [Halospeciosus flavus]